MIYIAIIALQLGPRSSMSLSCSADAERTVYAHFEVPDVADLERLLPGAQQPSKHAAQSTVGAISSLMLSSNRMCTMLPPGGPRSRS